MAKQSEGFSARLSKSIGVAEAIAEVYANRRLARPLDAPDCEGCGPGMVMGRPGEERKLHIGGCPVLKVLPPTVPLTLTIDEAIVLIDLLREASIYWRRIERHGNSDASVDLIAALSLAEIQGLFT